MHAVRYVAALACARSRPTIRKICMAARRADNLKVPLSILGILGTHRVYVLSLQCDFVEESNAAVWFAGHFEGFGEGKSEGAYQKEVDILPLREMPPPGFLQRLGRRRFTPSSNDLHGHVVIVAQLSRRDVTQTRFSMCNWCNWACSIENHSVAKLSREKGNIAFKAKEYATARSLYSHAMAFDQPNPLYPLNRSMANLKLERWDEAEANATKTLDLCPHNLKALFRRGRARKELGKWDQAREDFRMFIDNEGDPTLGAQELKTITDAESSPPSEPSSYTPSDLDTVLQIFISRTTRHPSPFMHQGIFITNPFTVGAANRDCGVCVRASRFNHSCSPNAKYSFDSNTGDLRIHALGTIPCGEEIFITYIGCRQLFGSTRQSRQANLRTRYHFTCACSTCSLPEAKSKMSDARRRKVNELWEIAGRLIPTQEDQCFNVVVEAMCLLRQEGYLDDEADFLYEAGPMSRI
ncbi:hypothetical protein V8E53_013292 [Lactarius tabidus]